MTGWWFPWQVDPILLADGKYYHRKSQKKYPTSYKKRAKKLKERHVDWFGLVCLGDRNHEPHRVSYADLSVDHVTPIKYGGSHQIENLRVLCKYYNKRREDLEN